MALGVPFAREYGGTLSNRSFGGSQVSRTFYARGQTGQQLLYAVVQALLRQVEAGRVELCPQRDLLDLITLEGVARGAICRHRLSGALETHTAHAVLLASGGYSNVFHRSTNAVRSNASALWRSHRRGALMANPCFTQIHPTCIPSGDPDQSKLTLMSESLRNDGRVWLPRQPGDQRRPDQVPEAERDYFLERLYPSYGNMVPRDVASRRARELCGAGHGVGPAGRSIYLDFNEAIERQGRAVIEARYGNLFSMYERITGADPYREPMRIYPAPHYTMGGLWVDYHLMSTIPGLFVLGEANFSEHGANRLGASALMQGLADGLFIAPATVPAWLAEHQHPVIDPEHPACRAALESVRQRIIRLRSTGGSQPAEGLRRRLGALLIESCGISRSAAGLRSGLAEVAALQASFDQDLLLPDPGTPLDPELEKALQLEDYLELADLMLRDALAREESCGAHFREEHQSESGEALRRDAEFSHIAAWEWRADGPPIRHQEPLHFSLISPTARSYR